MLKVISMTDKEKIPYHKIMVDTWRLFIKERTCEKFSDKWWEELIDEYRKLRTPYIGTELDDYVCWLSQVFLDEYERKHKIAKQKRISKTILSDPQKGTPKELQCSDSVCQMGGFEEVVEPFT